MNNKKKNSQNIIPKLDLVIHIFYGINVKLSPVQWRNKDDLFYRAPVNNYMER